MNSLLETNIKDYTDVFIQRSPSFGVNYRSGWRTLSYPLHDDLIKKHLECQKTVGTIARWYPEYAVLDMDDIPKDRVGDIRAELGLDTDNSMLCSSESSDSYHLLIRPEYNGKPPTTKLLQDTLKVFIREKGIELYPQKRRKIRLPLGKFQECLDFEYRYLQDWQDKLYSFNKLDSFDLRSVKNHQMELPFEQSKNTSLILLGQNSGCFQQGSELLKNGLQAFGTRHESQFKIIYYMWRSGVMPDETIRRVWAWIQKKHNNFSNDILKNSGQVKYEIKYQTAYIFNNYELTQTYPDKTHNSHNGYICKPDLETIISLTRGSLPRIKFLFEIVKYSYPRRHRQFLNIHSDKLRRWGNERTYNKYLNELDEKGILSRSSSYLSGSLAKEIGQTAYAKSLKLKWQYKSSTDAILYEGRALDTFESAVKMIYKPSDFRAIIRKAGASRQMASHAAKQVYEDSKNVK